MGENSIYSRYHINVRKKVWAKAGILEGHPPDIWRRDRKGNVINWQEYGNDESQYGWKIITTNQGSNAIADIEHLHPVHNKVKDINF